RMHAEARALFKECASYAEEIRMTTDYVKRQEAMNSHLECQVSTWKEEVARSFIQPRPSMTRRCTWCGMR
ncbi:MAG: hypothetical protein ACKPKO_62125, partial [Candidatus Fonsibacter sp.]